MHIIPIASGKGGVGKSLVSANLSISLANSGRRVVLVDLDLGASNLHLILGLRAPRHGIGTYLSSSNIKFEEIITQTDYENLRFIAGDAEIPGLANIKPLQKNQLIKKLLALDTDYLVLDLGAGTNSNILDFFLISGQGIIVTTPTLTATLNAYLFLKNACFRLMYTTFKPKTQGFEYLEKLRKDGSSLQKVYLPAILETIKSIDPENYSLFREKAERFRPRLIMNMLEDPHDAEKAQKIRRSCREYLAIDVEHLGILYRDDLQDVALSSRMPIVMYKPNSVLSQAIFRVADKVISMEDSSEDPLSTQFFDDTYTTAEMEAEIDFDQKLSYVEEILHTGALSMGDLVETVKSQQFEINQLRKENNLIKHKLIKAMEQGSKHL